MNYFTKPPRFTFSEIQHDPFLKSKHDLDIEILSGNCSHLLRENVFLIAKDEQYMLFYFLS